MKSLPLQAHPDLLVGLEWADDAGVLDLEQGTVRGGEIALAVHLTGDELDVGIGDEERFAEHVGRHAAGDDGVRAGNRAVALHGMVGHEGAAEGAALQFDALSAAEVAGVVGVEDAVVLDHDVAVALQVAPEMEDAVAEDRDLSLVGGRALLGHVHLESAGDLDIAVSNDSRPNFFFRNDGKGRFTESALTLGLAYDWEGSTEAFMGIDVGDYDNDGLLDLAVPSLRTEGFSLFRNLGGFFTDVSIATGIDACTSSVTGFAPVFLDYDNDGDLDLFFSTGEVRMGRAGSGAAGSFRDRYAMCDLLLENRNGKFVDVSSFAGPAFRHRDISRATSAGDYDNDGDLDLLITSMNGKARLLRNDTKGGHWIGFRLIGKSPNRDAIGARIVLETAGRKQLREIIGGGSYLGQRGRRLLFGLGGARTVSKVTIRWPDGSRTVKTNLKADRYYVVEQKGR